MSSTQRIWLQSYPPGVPADIDPLRYGALLEIFEESLARYPQRVAYTCLGRDEQRSGGGGARSAPRTPDSRPLSERSGRQAA